MFKNALSDRGPSPWQAAVLSASQEAFRDVAAAHSGNDDNASLLLALQCPDVFAAADEACACSADSSTQLLLRLLRWVKLVLLKLAASYYALPMVLALLPLTAGLAIGFCLGRRRSEGRAYDKRLEQIGERSDGWGLQKLRALPFTMVSYFFAGPRKILHNPPSGGSAPPRAVPRRKQPLSPRVPRVPASVAGLSEREDRARRELRSDAETGRESGVAADLVPRHVAIIMDGNRRYGTQVYGNATSGHWDGSRKVLQVAKWCIAERVQVLTVFAFSTENWRRDPSEIASLMGLFTTYCEELRVEAIARNIRVRILSTDDSRVPATVKTGFERLQRDTEHCRGGLEMNICLSYGGRGEIVKACRQLAKDCVEGRKKAEMIVEQDVQSALLTRHTCDPDVLIRTSGEERISNFLLWQLAYTELFFLDIHWPEFEKADLLNVIRSYASGRQRRFGK